MDYYNAAISPKTPKAPARPAATAPVARGAAAFELEEPAAEPLPVLPAPAVGVPVFFAVAAVVPPTTAAPVFVQTYAGTPVAGFPVVKDARAAECSFDQLTRADS